MGMSWQLTKTSMQLWSRQSSGWAFKEAWSRMTPGLAFIWGLLPLAIAMRLAVLPLHSLCELQAAPRACTAAFSGGTAMHKWLTPFNGLTVYSWAIT